jgi:hypothetical protein
VILTYVLRNLTRKNVNHLELDINALPQNQVPLNTSVVRTGKL